MEDIKIGDIVQGATSFKQKKFGFGIVISVKQSSITPITAIFLSEYLDFRVHDFKDTGLKKATVSKILHNQLNKLSYNYSQLLEELKRA